MEQHEKNEDIPKRLRLMKKFLKQALALVGILIVTLALSGCEKFVETDVSAETKNTIQTVSGTTVPANQEKTQFVTEFEITGWTIDDVTDELELDGIKFCLPCYYDELQDVFSENKNISFSDVNVVKIDNDIACNQRIIFFDNNEIGTILSTLNSDEVFGIHVNVYCKDYTSFNFEDVYVGKTTSDEIFEKYGTPNRGGNSLYFYQFGKRKDVYFVFDNNILQAMLINNISNYNKLINEGEYNNE